MVEVASRDPNRVPALLGHGYDYETVRVRARADGSLITDPLDPVDAVFMRYNAVVQYKDDFSDGRLHGWQYQYDTNNRVGITLDDVAMTSTYSLLMHTRPTPSDQAWSRKGLMVPDGVTKILIGTYFMFHGANANNPATVNFDFDWQNGAGGSHRRYIRFQYLNYASGLQNKWRVNTGTPTVQAFTDVTGATMQVAWNESDKPMLNYMIGVYNVVTQQYEALYANGNAWDISTQSIGPTAGTDLTNFNGGAIHLHVVENRSDSSEDNLFWIEKPILGYVL
jgi:hypothetical protein